MQYYMKSLSTLPSLLEEISALDSELYLKNNFMKK